MGKRARKRNAGATDEQILSELVGQEPTDKPLVTVGDFDAPDTTENDQAQPEVDATEHPEEQGQPQPQPQPVTQSQPVPQHASSGGGFVSSPTNFQLNEPMQGSGSDVSEKLEKIAKSNEQIEGLLASMVSILNEGLEVKV